MALHTAQLTCIMVFVIIVTGKAQCINDTQQLQEKAQQFYCTAVSLRAPATDVSTILCILYKYLILFLQQLSTVYVTMNITNCNLSQVKGTIQQFTNTCEIFTTINAFKYQLLHYLFHGNEAISDMDNFVSVLSHLQTAAGILQEISMIDVSGI